MFERAPEYLGTTEAVQTVVEGGCAFAETAAGQIEVVLANAARAAELGGEAGVYIVVTGSTGATEAFLTLGIVYFVVMMIAAFQYRVPAPDWKPEGWEPKPAAKGMVSQNNVHIDQALKTPQFWQLWVMLASM